MLQTLNNNASISISGDYLLAAVALVFCAAAVIMDIIHGKITNRLLIIGMAVTLAIRLFFHLSGYSTAALAPAAINFAIAFALAFAAWKFSMWSAGDAKLFAFISFALPAPLMRNATFLFFPSFDLFINIFITALLWLILQEIAGKIRSLASGGALVSQETRDGFSSAVGRIRENIGPVLISFVFFTVLYEILQRTSAAHPRYIPPNTVNSAFIAVIFILNGKFTGFIKKTVAAHPGPARVLYIACIASIAGAAVTPQYSEFVIGRLRSVFMFFFIAGSAQKILETRMPRTDVIKTTIRDITEGAVPHSTLLEMIGREGLEMTVYSDGLTREQTALLRNTFPFDTEVEIVRTYPFAPKIFTALVITFLLASSMIRFIRDLA